MRNIQTKTKRQGFTLIELSISLVIIALITSGIILGKSLIRQSEVSSVMIDTRKYISAVQAFRQKYAALPGDMPNATNYWGIAAGSTGSDSTCMAAGSATSTATCNGNGDGQISWTSANGIFQNETLRLWQHLANAGLITGVYTGISNNVSDLKTNSPAGRPANLGYGITWIGISSGDANLFDGIYNHMMFIGGVSSIGPPAGATLTGLEAQALDTKFDDALPATGALRSWKAGAFNIINCSTGTDATATYSTSSQPVCTLLYITGF